jgi:hypothetical protein
MITMKKFNGRLELDNDRPQYWDSNILSFYTKNPLLFSLF